MGRFTRLLARWFPPPDEPSAPAIEPAPDRPSLAEMLLPLPEPALRAFLARCALRVRPLLLALPPDDRLALDRAIALAEAWARGEAPDPAARAAAFSRAARAVAEAHRAVEDRRPLLPVRLAAEVAALAVAEGDGVFLAWDPDGMGFDPSPGGAFVAAASAARQSPQVVDYFRLNFGDQVPARIRSLAPAELWGCRGTSTEDDHPRPSDVIRMAQHRDAACLRNLCASAGPSAAPTDPSPSGPLGPLWGESEEPPWYGALSAATHEDWVRT